MKPGSLTHRVAVKRGSGAAVLGGGGPGGGLGAVVGGGGTISVSALNILRVSAPVVPDTELSSETQNVI